MVFLLKSTNARCNGYFVYCAMAKSLRLTIIPGLGPAGGYTLDVPEVAQLPHPQMWGPGQLFVGGKTLIGLAHVVNLFALGELGTKPGSHEPQVRPPPHSHSRFLSRLIVCLTYCTEEFYEYINLPFAWHWTSLARMLLMIGPLFFAGVEFGLICQEESFAILPMVLTFPAVPLAALPINAN